MVKSVMEWYSNTNLHHNFLSKLEDFYDLPKDAMDHSSQKLSIGFELIALIWKMPQSVSNKFDSAYDDVTWHVGALGSGILQLAWQFLLVVSCSLDWHI